MKSGVGFVDPEIARAADYYRCFRLVPITSSSSIWAHNVFLNEGESFTLYNLVKSMEGRVKYGDDLLIACHGNRHSISLRPGAGLWLDNAALEMMLNPSSDQAALLHMSKDDYIDMITRIEKIQKLKIDHIALRACRIGNDRKFLSNFARLLGARSISAPTTRTMYANPVYFGAEIDKSAERMFRSMYDHYMDVPLRTLPQKKTVIGTRKIAHSSFKAGFWIETRDVFRRFLIENMPGSTTPTPAQERFETPIPIHAFCVPGDPSRFYFPKDPRYAQALTFQYSGAPPQSSGLRNTIAAA